MPIHVSIRATKAEGENKFTIHTYFERDNYVGEVISVLESSLEILRNQAVSIVEPRIRKRLKTRKGINRLRALINAEIETLTINDLLNNKTTDNVGA